MGAFRYFYPRLVPGGVIMSDDYNWPGAKKAIDAFGVGKNPAPPEDVLTPPPAGPAVVPVAAAQ